MVQGKSVVAGVFGVICAVAILGLMVLVQGGGILFSPSLVASNNTPSASPSSSGGQYVMETNNNSASNSNESPGASSFGTSLGPAGPSSNSAQTIGSPILSVGNIVLLGIVSLIVSLGVVLVISRRLN
jgi:hypothetical protein